MKRLLLLLAATAAFHAHALTPDEAKAIAIGEMDTRIEALNKAATTGDDKTAAFIQAMSDDAVKFTADKVFVIKDDKAFDPVTGAEQKLPDDAEDVVNNNMMRGALDAAQAALKLTSKDDAVRAEAAQALFKEPDESRLPLVEKALAAEANPKIKAQLELVRAASMLSSTDKDKRLAAASDLGASRSPETKLLLNERLSDETDAEVRGAIGTSIRDIDASLVWGDRINAIFSGVSLGSVLLLAALGLAITYGLMGVINMAHGELMMIGAYATYVMQGIFQRYLPESAFGLYLVAAIPVAFLASA
ncbi:MAG: urea ABC transporter permease subunit UrtB, partial [Rhizobacter sp.]